MDSEFKAEMRQGNLDIQRTLGRLEQGQSSLDSFIKAVSVNVKDVDKKIDEHGKDDGAHGIKTMRWMLGSFIALATLVFIGIEVWKM